MQHPRLQKFHIIKEDKKKYHQHKLKNKFHDLKAENKGLDKVYFELKQKIKSNWSDNIDALAKNLNTNVTIEKNLSFGAKKFRGR